jgi:hypothetical protein
VDKWIKEIWTFVQNDPQYKNKTAIFITTDHGRGDINKEEWKSHGSSIADAYRDMVCSNGLPTFLHPANKKIMFN